MHISACVGLYIHTSIYIYIYVHTHMCMYVYECVRVYYTYIYVHTYTLICWYGGDVDPSATSFFEGAPEIRLKRAGGSACESRQVHGTSR